MGIVADIYGMPMREALALDQREVNVLLAKAEFEAKALAVTSPEMQTTLRARLAPTLRHVREARAAREQEEGSGKQGGSGGVGPPNL